MSGRDTARFAREWKAAFVLMAVGSGLLLAAGRTAMGLVVAGVCGAAVLARLRAMRRQGRGFYGQEKQSR